MYIKYEANLYKISCQEYQKQIGETSHGNKALFYINSEKNKQTIKKANRIFDRIWGKENKSDICIKMSDFLTFYKLNILLMKTSEPLTEYLSTPWYTSTREDFNIYDHPQFIELLEERVEEEIARRYPPDYLPAQSQNIDLDHPQVQKCIFSVIVSEQTISRFIYT